MVSGPRGVRLGELTFVDVSKEAIKLHGEWEADGLGPARGEVGWVELGLTAHGGIVLHCRPPVTRAARTWYHTISHVSLCDRK